MLATDDTLYKECCAVLRQTYKLTETEKAFCEWVGSEFGIRPPIHVAADTNPAGRHYLHMALHTPDEAEGFFAKSDTSYERDEAKQDLILQAAKETGFLDEVKFVSKRDSWWRKGKKRFFHGNAPARAPKDWYVYWSAFNPVAIQEALSKVPPGQREAILSEFSEHGLMRLETVFSGTVMMFETEAQRIQSEQDGTQALIATRWHETVIPFDEFRVLADSRLDIKFESNEAFQRDYGGSWFNYTR